MGVDCFDVMPYCYISLKSSYLLFEIKSKEKHGKRKEFQEKTLPLHFVEKEHKS